jgi:hypothetical protein
MGRKEREERMNGERKQERGEEGGRKKRERGGKKARVKGERREDRREGGRNEACGPLRLFFSPSFSLASPPRPLPAVFSAFLLCPCVSAWFRRAPRHIPLPRTALCRFLKV